MVAIQFWSCRKTAQRRKPVCEMAKEKAPHQTERTESQLSHRHGYWNRLQRGNLEQPSSYFAIIIQTKLLFFLKKIEKEKKDISFLRSLSTHLPISLGPNAHFVVSEPSAHQVTSLKGASKDKSLIQEINSHKKYSNVNVRVFTSVVMRSSCCVRRTWMSIPLRNKEINEGWFMWIDWNQIKL